MSQLSTNLPADQLQAKWASQLNPIISNPMTNMTILPVFALKTGVNVINHTLAQTQQGWQQLDIDAAITVYRSAPFNSTTLTLTASGPANIILGVF